MVGLDGNYWAKMVGKVEEIGVKTQKDGLKLGIELLEPNLVKKNWNLKLGGCNGAINITSKFNEIKTKPQHTHTI